MFIASRALQIRNTLLFTTCLSSLLLAASATASPPSAIDVAVSNSSNSRTFWADFVESDSAIQLNADANQSSALRSLAFFSNICGSPRLDLIAADTNGGDLRYYAGGENRWATSTSMCTGGNCPARPAGLAASNAHESLSGIAAQRVAAANTGGAGTAPQLWFFTPDCENDDRPFMGGGFPGGLFTVEGFGLVGAIADTEFVRVAGGGLGVGDLLVSVGSPNLIARVKAADIDALVDHGTPLPPAEIVVGPEFFGSSAPAGLALVPGTANSEQGRNETLLVTVPPARVIKLNIGEPTGTLAQHLFFTEGLGNGPLGIAAGTRGVNHYMVIADRQQGRVVQARLFVDPDTGAELCNGQGCPVEIEAIKDNLQFPLGIAFNSDVTFAGNCTGPEGCQLGSAIQLFLPEVDDNDKLIIAELVFVLDDREDDDTPLDLPPGFGGDFRLPASCRGFEVDGWPMPVVPVVNLTTEVEISPATVVNVQEVLSGILAQVPNCDQSGSRILHHRLPDGFDTQGNSLWDADAPEQGTLVDSTVFCSNPNRGLNDGVFSPFALCADRYFRPAADGLLTSQERRAVKDEVLHRADNLEIVIEELLSGNADFGALKLFLEETIEDARFALRRGNPSRADFLAASALFEAGAAEILGSSMALPWSELPKANAYGNLFLRFFALAFFNSETAAQVSLCPGAALQDEIGINCS